MANVRPFAPKESPSLPVGPTDRFLKAGFKTADVQVHLDIPYLVKGICDRGQLIVMWGAPGSGKTFVALSLAAHIGSGTAWAGRRVKQGRVLYVCAESTRKHLENRLAALTLMQPDVADADVTWCPISADFRNTEQDVLDVMHAAQTLGDVALIVVDTLAVTFGGGNENAPEDMGQYVTNMKAIKTATGAAVLVVHHCGKDEAKGMRGHTSLLGALDSELIVERPPTGPRVLKAGKLREGDSFSDLCAFDLEVKVLGTDSEGDPVTTCWMKPSTAPVCRRPTFKAQAQILNLIEAAYVRGERLWTQGEVTAMCRDAGKDAPHRNSVKAALIGLAEGGWLAYGPGGYGLTNPPEATAQSEKTW